MLKEERCNEILRLVNENGFLTVDFLCKELDYSPATIRRDLTYMQQKKMIKKSYGGVSPVISNKKYVQLYEIRKHDYVPQKRKIAATAAKLIKNGQIIFIDSSSTCFNILDFIEENSNITVITNSLDVSLELRKRNINGYCTGGLIHTTMPSLTGKTTCEMLKGINIDIAFFASASISSDGLISEYSEDLTTVLNQVIKCSEKVAYLAYSNRIGTSSMFNICSIKDIDYLISECNVRDKFTCNTENITFL